MLFQSSAKYIFGSKFTWLDLFLVLKILTRLIIHLIIVLLIKYLWVGCSELWACSDVSVFEFIYTAFHLIMIFLSSGFDVFILLYMSCAHLSKE